MFNIYLTEIKNRFLLVLLNWVFLFFVSYSNKEVLLFLTVKNNIEDNEKFYFIATSVIEIFNSYLNLAYFASFQFSFYFILFHSISFVFPALYSLERLKIRSFFFFSCVAWLVGSCIFVRLALPVCWSFFLSFQNTAPYSLNIFLELSIEKYLSVYYKVYYLTIFFFQILLGFLLFVDTLTATIKFLKKTRKLVYFLMILSATFFTPPDIFSQLALFGVFSIIYELSMVIIVLKKVFF